MSIGKEEALLGGVEPQFVVNVSAPGAAYGSRGQPSSGDAFTTALREAATHTSSMTPIFIGTAVAACLALVVEPWLLLPALIVGSSLLAWASARDARRRRVAVVYRLDDRAARAFASLGNGVGWLANSRAVWRITHEERAQRPANTTSVLRSGAVIARGEAANILTNVGVPSIAAAGETLLFLPDALLVRDRTSTFVALAVKPTASAPKSFAIPPKPPGATTASGIDMDRVRLKIAETREVSTLLSSIFAEDEAPVTVAPSIVQANTIGTLDPAHSELLRRLAERATWPRDEVERLAGELSLLPDGALETINDYAYTTANEPFWEDDDPVAINSHIAMELIA